MRNKLFVLLLRPMKGALKKPGIFCYFRRITFLAFAGEIVFLGSIAPLWSANY